MDPASEKKFREDFVSPPPNLVLDGVPPIPIALEDRKEKYNGMRSASIASWHPTEREMLVILGQTGLTQVYKVAYPGADRKQITFYNERVVSASYRRTKGDGFIFARDVGASEFYQLYWRDLQTKDTTLLTDGKSLNTGGLWSNNGEWYAFQSTKRNGKDLDIYAVRPPDTSSVRLLLNVEGSWAVEDWSADDKTLLLSQYLSRHDSSLHLLNMRSGEVEKISPDTKEKTGFPSGVFSKDGKSLFMVSDNESEFFRLFRLDLQNRQLSPLTADDGHVKSFRQSQDGKYLCYVLSRAGIETLHAIELENGHDRVVHQLPFGVISHLRFRRNSHELGFVFSTATANPDVYSINLDDSKMERWTFSECGVLDPEEFTQPEPISWKSFDGLEITGFLYKPPKKFKPPWPVIIDIHGGPEVKSEPGFKGFWNYYLNELGIALLFPNVRGSSGFGKTFASLDDVFKREDSVRDIGALLDWVAANPALDASRVMVEGGSYGGYMVYSTMIQYPEKIRCGFVNVGIANFITFLENTEAYRRDLRRVEYGDEREPAVREFLQRISPTTNAHKINKPLLIAHGKNDPRVPYTEAEQIVKAVRSNGVPVWYVLAKDEGHGFSKGMNRNYLNLVEMLFIEENLLK